MRVVRVACGDYVRKVLRANIPGLEQEQEQGGLLKPSSALPCDAPIDRAAQLGADSISGRPSQQEAGIIDPDRQTIPPGAVGPVTAHHQGGGSPPTHHHRHTSYLYK